MAITTHAAYDATYFIRTALIGVYLGALFLGTNNLLAPITTHAVYDFLALMYLVRWKARLRPKPPEDAESP